MEKKTKQLSGGARLKANGYKLIQLAVTEDELALLRAAAECERRPITQFILSHIFPIAKKIVAKNNP